MDWGVVIQVLVEVGNERRHICLPHHPTVSEAPWRPFLISELSLGVQVALIPARRERVQEKTNEVRSQRDLRPQVQAHQHPGALLC